MLHTFVGHQEMCFVISQFVFCNKQSVPERCVGIANAHIENDLLYIRVGPPCSFWRIRLGRQKFATLFQTNFLALHIVFRVRRTHRLVQYVYAKSRISCHFWFTNYLGRESSGYHFHIVLCQYVKVRTMPGGYKFVFFEGQFFKEN